MNKNRIGVILILVILSIILLVVVFNLVDINKKLSDNKIDVEQNNNDTNVKPETKPNDNLSPESSEDKLISLDINSMFVQNLYKYIIKYNPNTEETVYQNRKVTPYNISNELKIITIFNNIDIKKEYDDIKKYNREDTVNKEFYYEYIFEESKINRKAKEIFGEDVIITPLKKEIPFNSNLVRYEDGKYIINPFGPNGLADWDSRGLLISAERKGNEVYLYDKYYHTDNTNYPECYRKIYNASDRKVLLPELTTEEIDKFINNRENNLVFKYSNTFKHTFKINDKGVYNFVSTEIVK